MHVGATSVVRAHLESLGLMFPAKEAGLPVTDVPATLVEEAIQPWRTEFEAALPDLDLLLALGREHQAQHALRVQKLNALSASCANAKPSGPALEGPFPFQQAGFEWLLLADCRAILGDDMGLGKTVQALLCLQEVAPRRFLVVTTTSTLRNWVKEAARWTRLSLVACGSGKHISKRISGTKKVQGLRDMEDSGGMVVTWGLLDRALGALSSIPWDFIVVDEAHYAKSPSSRRFRALASLALPAKHRLLVTGTDIPNRPRELWPLLHLVDPAAFPLFHSYGERFCGPRLKVEGGREKRTYDGSTHRPELAREIRAYRIKRLKVNVLDQLPPKIRQVLELEPVLEISEAYEAWQAQVREAASGSLAGEALSALSALRLAAGMAKVEAAVEWISNAVSPEDPVVAFLWHKGVHDAVLKGLTEAGLRVASIVGKTSGPRRQEIVDLFQSGQLDVVLGSSAMKEGVTLTRARLLLRIERWWTPGDEDQAADRIHRIGQVRGVQITSLHLPGSTDDHVVRLLDQKAKWIDDLGGVSFVDLLLHDLRRGLHAQDRLVS